MIFSFLQIIEVPGGQQVSGPTYLKPFLAAAKLGGVISVFIPVILVIAGLLTFIWLIIAGFRYIFSAGDPKAMEAARNQITFALIGFVIVFGAWWLILIVQQALRICIVGVLGFCPA